MHIGKICIYCRSTQGYGENSVDQILRNLVTGAYIYNIQLRKWQIAFENKSDSLPVSTERCRLLLTAVIVNSGAK